MERHQRALEEFASMIERAIRSKGWSHKTAGDHLGAKQQSVSRWINGQNLPESDRLETIAEVLDLDEDDLHSAWDAAALAKYGRASRSAQKAVDRALRAERESAKASYEDLQSRLADLEAKFAEIVDRCQRDS